MSADVFDLDAYLPPEPPPDDDRRPERDPDRYFGKHGLDIDRLVDDVLAAGPIARSIDGRLWHYGPGVWLAGGDDEVSRRVHRLLGGRFRKAHLTNVLTIFGSAHQTITANPHGEIVNVVNGLLRWRTGELEAHRPDVRSTVQLPVLWNPEATCPAIDAWLAEVIADDAREFVDELLGYLVLNGNPLHVAVLLLGAGRNGKGTFLRLVTALLGASNVASVPLQTLAENRFAAASLFGKLANVCGDLDARMLDRSDTFKMATGGDTLYGEHKYGASFTFEPWCTMLFSANQAPPSRDTSEGYYARWLVVPFTAQLTGRLRPQHELDAELHQAAELEGLLVRAVHGLQRLMARGRFDLPPSVLAAGEEFRRTTDPVASFVAECCTVDPDLALPRTDVFTRYRQWCDENGHRPLSASRFYDRLLGAVPSARAKTVRGTRMVEGLGKGGEWHDRTPLV